MTPLTSTDLHCPLLNTALDDSKRPMTSEERFDWPAYVTSSSRSAHERG